MSMSNCILKKLTNEPGMSMKTKHEVKKSESSHPPCEVQSPPALLIPRGKPEFPSLDVRGLVDFSVDLKHIPALPYGKRRQL